MYRKLCLWLRLQRGGVYFYRTNDSVQNDVLEKTEFVTTLDEKLIFRVYQHTSMNYRYTSKGLSENPEKGYLVEASVPANFKSDMFKKFDGFKVFFDRKAIKYVKRDRRFPFMLEIYFKLIEAELKKMRKQDGLESSFPPTN